MRGLLKLQERVIAVEKIVGHHFSNQKLVVSAITHPSAVEGRPVSESYERLEFLGDSIVGAIVATELFERFPQMDEGELTRLKISLVSGPMLSEVADSLGVGQLIVFGESERGTGARGLRSALENVYESLVGALYLDTGYEVTHAFVLRTLGPHITPQIAERPISPKSRLQEVVQRDFKCAPVYKLEEECGPAHAPTFVSAVLVEGKRVGRGSGGSKKESETIAAEEALDHLGYQSTNDPSAASEAKAEDHPCI